MILIAYSFQSLLVGVRIMSVEGEIIEEPFEINHDIDGFEILENKMK